MADTLASAGVAMATATVPSPRTDIDSNAGVSTAAATVANQATHVKPNVETPTATGTGADLSAILTTVAETATATGEVPASVAGVGGAPDTATATTTSGTPTASLAVDADLASAVGRIDKATPAHGPGAGAPTASGSAHGSSMRSRANPGVATAVGSADEDPTITDAAQARVARGTGVGRNARYDADVTTGVAEATGASHNPTRNARAVLRIARGEGTALGADALAGAQGGSASATGSAANATVVAFPVTSAPAGAAQGSGIAFGLSIISAFRSGVANAVGTAYNASVSVANDLVEIVESEDIVSARLTQTFQTTAQPHCLLWHPDQEEWAVEQVQARHNGALWRLGEYSMFVLLWRVEDFEAGLVGRCPECVGSMGDIGEVYNQSTLTRCPTCYGTTFEGGFKARIVRPALWDFSETTNRVEAVGEVEKANAAVQSTNDFAMRTGDYIIRADGTRWRVQSLSTNHLHTGFGHPGRAETVVGFNYGTVILQDEASNAYSMQLPADPSFLDVRNPRSAVDFTRFEEIRAPILAAR